jgi:steroid 5-alpha reductase family enzyme
MTPEQKHPGLLQSFTYVIVAYTAAAAGAVALVVFFGELHPIAVVAIADVGATIIIFAFSVLFNNSSFYDAYWSVAPVPIAFYWALVVSSPGVDPWRQTAVIILVSLWAIRLTWNWASQWEGLSHEDWRYVDMRESAGKNYWAVSFSGIHMFPTILVFGASLSMFASLARGTSSFNWLDIAAIIVTFIAILIEATADIQLKMFRRMRRDEKEIMNYGLWKYSRHPNYFGEILFWWGLYLFALAADPAYWWTVVGPLGITLLFVFISIPMMDRRMVERRPHYAEHIKKVSAILPLPPRS